MHRGWVKQWRKETESAIWDRPPLTYKIWRYLLMSADYRTGTLRISGPQLAEAVQWEENNAVVIPDRKTIGRHLEWMESAGMLVTKVSGSSSRRFYDITICNWSTYQSESLELVTEIPEACPKRRPPLQELQEVQALQPSVVQRAPDLGTPHPDVPTEPTKATPPTSDDDFPATDPDYVLDPHYRGNTHLAEWTKHVGPVSTRYQQGALQAFWQLHARYHLSAAQISALILHIGSDTDARRWWGREPARLVGHISNDPERPHVWESCMDHLREHAPPPTAATDLIATLRAERDEELRASGWVEKGAQ